MKISMRMLAARLQEFLPEPSIEDDGLTIAGVRFLPDANIKDHTGDLYICSAEAYFDHPQFSGSYLAIHKHSYLLFRDCEFSELLNAILSAIEYYNAWEDRLQTKAMEEAELQELLDIAQEVVGNPLEVEGLAANSGILACSNPERFKLDPYWRYGAEYGTYHPMVYAKEYVSAIDGSRIRNLSSAPQIVENVYPGGDPVIMLYIKREGIEVGSVCMLQEDPSNTEIDMQIAPMLAQIFSHAKEFSAPDGSARSELAIFRDILEGEDVGEDNLAYLSASLPSSPWRLAIFRHVARDDRIATQHLLDWISSKRGLCMPTLVSEGAAAVVTDPKFPFFASGKVLDDNLRGWCIGLSMPSGDASTLLVRKGQSIIAMESSQWTEGVWGCEDHAFEFLVGEASKSPQARYMLHPAFELLERYDRENGGELLDTLCVYLGRFMSSARTSEQLHIHPNSLKYRLRRIREITGVTLADESELRHLMLSAWLLSGVSDKRG